MDLDLAEVRAELARKKEEEAKNGAALDPRKLSGQQHPLWLQLAAHCAPAVESSAEEQEAEKVDQPTGDEAAHRAAAAVSGADEAEEGVTIAADDVGLLSHAVRAATEHVARGLSMEDLVAKVRAAVEESKHSDEDASAEAGAAPMDDSTLEAICEMVSEIARLQSEPVSPGIVPETQPPNAQGAEASDGVQGARAAAAGARAAERLIATAREGLTPQQAVAVAVSSNVDEGAVAAAAVQRVTAEHEGCAPYSATTIAAHTACRLLACGASAPVAVAAGARAAMALVRGEKLDEVHASMEALAEACSEKQRWQTNLEPVDAPSWSMDGWLASLGLDKIVQKAWRHRFDEHIREVTARVSATRRCASSSSPLWSTWARAARWRRCCCCSRSRLCSSTSRRPSTRARPSCAS